MHFKVIAIALLLLLVLPSFAQKVGIGTSTPDRDLTIFDPGGDGDATMNLKDASREMFLGVNSSGATLRSLTNHDLSFWTNNVRHMTIDTDGKVGIGTNSPDTELHVVGADNDGTIASLKIKSGVQSMLIDGNEIDAVGSDLFLQNNTADDVILALGGGKVGIGTLSPDRDLTVFDTEGNGGAVINVKDATRELFLGVNSSGVTLRSLSNDKVSFWTNNTRHMTIGTDGNVGINTAAPVATLHILQPGTASGEGLRFEHPTISAINWDCHIDGFDDFAFDHSGAPKSYISHTDGAYVQVSDRTLKQDIMPVDSVLAKVIALRPVNYQFKSHPSAKKSIGFIAQEVETLFPEVVREKDGIKAINYDAFSVIAIQALKEQHTLINRLLIQNTELLKRIEMLENR